MWANMINKMSMGLSQVVFVKTVAVYDFSLEKRGFTHKYIEQSELSNGPPKVPTSRTL